MTVEAISTALVVVTALGFLSFVVLYWKLTRWWRDPIGQVFMGLAGLVGILLALVLLRRFVFPGEHDAWRWVGLGFWLALAIVAWRLPWVLLKTRVANRRRGIEKGANDVR